MNTIMTSSSKEDKTLVSPKQKVKLQSFTNLLTNLCHIKVLPGVENSYFLPIFIS